MVSWSGNELRENFLRFFESKGHLRLPSASLVPAGDPTLLLTGAGMVPFKPYFLGKEEPPSLRITTCQRCLRTLDIQNVGLTARHGTFFEMLGNFSFGDYFKKEAIEWAWEFTTQHLKFPPDKLWVTIYTDDDEAEAIWHKGIGVPIDRIVRLGREDNFWEIGVGPCGPCSELHFDRGIEYGCGRPDCAPGCDCDRFLEFWNLVFIQFYQDAAGNLEPLERTGIDTGMGLDRVCTLLQGVDNIFEIDLVRPIIGALSELAQTAYGEDEAKDVSMRVVTDHIRGVTFMVHDGILPGNEGRGYVLRRLARRAVRHGHLLGIEGPFLKDLAAVVIQVMKAGYPELPGRADYIYKVIELEEERFQRTLDQGMAILTELMAELEAKGAREISGDDAFRLYDTYGFPLELTKEIAEESGFRVDEEGFRRGMMEQRERARAAHRKTGYLGDETETVADALGLETQFIGYDHLEGQARILALLVDGQSVPQVEANQQVDVVLDVTPFYPTGGGQQADVGVITAKDGQCEVDDVQRVGAAIIHRGKVRSGSLKVGDEVLAEVDRDARAATARNHTATHLLHQALRRLLGEHVAQSGSLVDPHRLRFDFTHFEGISPEGIKELEEMVNGSILANLPVLAEEMSMAKAEELGAIALFGEKYGDQVRVVSVGDYSRELCGGTHVRATGEIGPFTIVSEGSIAAGVRRIEALTGFGALRYQRERGSLLEEAAGRLETSPERILVDLDRTLKEKEELARKLSKLQKLAIRAKGDELLAGAEGVNAVNLLVSRVEDADMETLRQMGDYLRDRLQPGIVVLGSAAGDKVVLLGMASKELVGGGIHMGEIIKKTAQLVGGSGGGRPDMAQAGGKEPQKLDEALRTAKETLRKLVGEMVWRQ
ncbi:MAG: alanine--tRNA ligase [Firmicutes bacterium]|nr:alanine--tRNA ligase [Bacillota bacterium]